MTAVLVTHETRGAELARTLPQLHAAGLDPLLLTSANRNPAHVDAEVRRLGGLACRLAHDRGTPLLFLEDDIDVDAPIFARQLTIARDLEVPVTFCLLRKSLYDPATRRKIAAGNRSVGVVRLINAAADRGYHGSMAVLLPRAMVAHAAANPGQFERPNGTVLREPTIQADRVRRKVTGFDFWIKEHADRFGGLHAALPNSVTHRAPPSVRTRLAEATAGA